MIGWSTQRRLLYVAIISGLILVLGVALLVVAKPAPSCTDGKKNQDEVGIDCGGGCSRVCPQEIKEVKVIWTRIFKTDDKRYDAATLIENPNRSHGVKELKYNVRVLDANNLLVSIRSGSVFLNPGETYLIYDNRLTVGNRVPARANFIIDDAPVWQKVEQATPPLKLAVKAFTNTPTPQLVVTVTNPTLQELSNVAISALLSNKQQNALAVSSTLVETLPAESTKEIFFTWPQPFTEDPVFFDFYPHVNVANLAQ
jgi:hypothetical protein